MNDILQTSLSELKGVGAARKKALSVMGLETLADLVYLMPLRWEDRGSVLSVEQLLQADELPPKVLVRGRVERIREGGRSRRLRVLTATISGDGGGRLEAVWFNQPYVRQALEDKPQVTLSATVSRRDGRLQLVSPHIETAQQPSRLLPVYPASEGLPQGLLRLLVQQALDICLPDIAETLPQNVIEREGLLNLSQALTAIHRPGNMEEALAGRKRLSFQKALDHLLSVRRMMRERTDGRGSRLKGDEALSRRLIETLPYRLTDDQAQALREIEADMASDRPMFRLLQGEVGSGKTVVAAAALLRAVSSGCQAAVLCPTEVLAVQSSDRLADLLDPLGVDVRCLYGGSSAKALRETLGALAVGEPMIVVGTHALIQERVSFGRLGFVVIDEQQRFGVLQRACMASKGNRPDILLMTATPIPRTLEMGIYGGIDVSSIRQLPAGRGSIRTAVAGPGSRDRVTQMLLGAVERGYQAYIVCPAIESEDDEDGDLQAAEGHYRHILDGALSSCRLGLMHGRLPSEEKERVMASFRSGQLDILVCTTVVEVGVDVPNAVLMVVEAAERFGLSQLHQLRGRVGRGSAESACVLMCGKPSAAALERLRGFVKASDCFEIAELDYRTRGPGNPCGLEQHGLEMVRFLAGLPETVVERAAYWAERLSKQAGCC